MQQQGNTYIDKPHPSSPSIPGRSKPTPTWLDSAKTPYPHLDMHPVRSKGQGSTEDKDEYYSIIPPIPPAKTKSAKIKYILSPSLCSLIPLLSSLCRAGSKFLTPPMFLADFVADYSKHLPVQIKVTTGYCGPSARLTSMQLIE